MEPKFQDHELYWCSVPITMTGWRCRGCNWKTCPTASESEARHKWFDDDRHRPEPEPATELWNYLVHRPL